MSATKPDESHREEQVHEDTTSAATDKAAEKTTSTPQEGIVDIVQQLQRTRTDGDETADISADSAGDGHRGGGGRNAIDGDDGDDGDDSGGPFKPVPPVSGEFRVSLSKLGEWEHHPKNGSREKSDHAAALILTASNPDALRPIVVLPPLNGAHPIVDGRFLWSALQAAHPGNEDVMVRCILFEGDEAAAVAAVCDTALGVIGASAIEQAQALLSLKLTNDVSQTAIAERYPRLTVSKVSNMLIAARMKKTYPVLFDILEYPDRVPISYGCDILTLKKTLPATEFQAILDRAADLVENGERFKPGDAFDALQVERPGKDAAGAQANVEEDDARQEVFGHDDQPVGTSEQMTDGSGRLCLPTAAAVTEMSLMEREAAADAFIVLVRRHFGVEQVG